jgi:hypothetical protein
MFRISKDADSFVDVETVEQIEPIIRRAEPGRYHINVITDDPLQFGHTSRRWGVGVKRADGSVVIDPDLWP